MRVTVYTNDEPIRELWLEDAIPGDSEAVEAEREYARDQLTRYGRFWLDEQTRLAPVGKGGTR